MLKMRFATLFLPLYVWWIANKLLILTVQTKQSVSRRLSAFLGYLKI